MLIECAKHPPEHVYHLLIQTLIPRPVAWVLSDNGNNTYNVAPFSFFNGVSGEPPIIMISAGWKNETTRKDTWVNIEERSHFVVHIASGQDAQVVSNSAIPFPHGSSEAHELEIELAQVPSQILPRIKTAKTAFFCEKYAIYEVGDDRQGMILGKINHIWVSDDIFKDMNGRWIVDAKALNPLARLGGNDYSLLGEVFTIKRRTLQGEG
jgi:flavin reductase (DIM6/NTAB) family NADH-FMN oxidoreductase RutF